MSKEEIIKQLQLAEEEFSGFCRCIDAVSFFRQPANKWSVAQNVKHLTISANTTRLAFILPKFILLLYTGKPNRLSRNFNELTNKYKTKLQQGGKASGRYIPANISPQVGKEAVSRFFVTRFFVTRFFVTGFSLLVFPLLVSRFFRFSFFRCSLLVTLPLTTRYSPLAIHHLQLSCYLCGSYDTIF